MSRFIPTIVLAAAALVAVPMAAARVETGIPLPQVVAAGGPSFASRDRLIDSGHLAQAGSREDQWSDESSATGPNSTVAWLMALGFLGLVVARRTRY